MENSEEKVKELSLMLAKMLHSASKGEGSWAAEKYLPEAEVFIRKILEVENEATDVVQVKINDIQMKPYVEIEIGKTEDLLFHNNQIRHLETEIDKELQLHQILKNQVMIMKYMIQE